MSRRTKNAVVLGVLGAALISTSALLAYPPILRLFRPRLDRPVIVLGTTHVQFGRLKPGQEVERTIEIENSGDRVLTIAKPTATCGCQKPEILQQNLSPGERTVLTVRQIAGPQLGPFRHVVFVKSNDPQSPNIDVYLDGTITQGVVVRPEPLVFEGMQTNELRTRFLEIASDEGKPFRIKFLNAFGPVRARGMLDVASVIHKIEITATAPSNVGPFEGTVVANLDIPDNPPLMIPVCGVVRGQFQVSPPSIDLGVVPGFSETVCTLLVRAGSEANFGIGKVGGELPAGWSVETKRQRLVASRGRLLELKIRVPDLKGPARATLSIEVLPEVGSSRVIEVPITALITERVTSN